MPNSSLSVVSGILSKVSFERVEHGYHGYKRSLQAFGRSIIICDHPDRPEMGTWCQISGEGLKILASLGHSVGSLLEAFARVKAKTKRIDIALDTSKVHVDQVVKNARLGAYRGMVRSRTTRLVESLGKAGKTLYFGSPQSDTMLRVYDKFAESGLRFDPDSIVYTRFEYQVRGDRACELASLWLSGDVAGVLGKCKAFVEFLVLKSSDSNISRRSLASWYKSLFKDVRPVKFSPKVVALASIERLSAWITRQWLPTLATLIETDQLAQLCECAVIVGKSKKQKQLFLKNLLLLGGGLRLGSLQC